MAAGLIDALGLGRHELVSFVGAGGKTTTMFLLADELREAGRSVLVTTTTKMGADQHDPDLWAEPFARDQRKVIGPGIDAIEARFAASAGLAVLVEADGARHATVKAPGPFEPALCPSTTVVVAVIGAGALDRVIADQAFRPLRVAAAAGCSPYDRLTVERAAGLLMSPIGGRKGVTDTMRFAVVIANVTERTSVAADRLSSLLHDRHGITAVAIAAMR